MHRAARYALGAIALAGCSDLLAPPAPDWITNRQPLAACGSETIDDTALTASMDGRRCLLTALRDGGAAEFISTRATEAGDPVTSYYRIHGNGTIELFVDATRDRLGQGRWERYSCGTLVPPEHIDPELASRDADVVELKCIPLPTP